MITWEDLIKREKDGIVLINDDDIDDEFDSLPCFMFPEHDSQCWCMHSLHHIQELKSPLRYERYNDKYHKEAFVLTYDPEEEE